MADTKAALATPTDLNRNDTKSVADALNSALADCFTLYFKTKNFHWHVSGPHFRDYHLLLDDQAAQIYGVTDAIAERVRKTGNVTIRSIGDIARRQTIKDNDADLPGIANHPSYDMFKGMSLRAVQPMSNGKLTDEALKKTEADLAAIK